MDDNHPHLHPLASLIDGGARVVFLTGAGLSVASGIAPYRLAPDAVWNGFVTEWGTVQRFWEDPHRWWTHYWLKSHPPETLLKEPNAGHRAISALLNRGSHALITQNVDGLHRKAGVDDGKYVEIHGFMGNHRCLAPECRFHVDEVIAGVDLSVLDHGDVPRCPDCGEPVLPLVLFFDEHYGVHPAFGFFTACQWLRKCDALVCVGTSFSVGITALALELCEERKVPVYNFNLYPEDGMLNVIGPAEDLLTELLR